MKNLTLLAIDDDDLILQSLRIGIPQHWRLVSFNSHTKVPTEGHYHAAFVDMHLTGRVTQAEGLEVIKKLKEQWPHLQIVAMSGDLDRDLMEQCLRAGASRYIAKPINLDEVILLLDKIEALLLMQDASVRQNSKELKWIGSGDLSNNVRQQMALLRGERGPILIEGESGTGKEVVAQMIHHQEPGRPFIPVNVSAIPENLFESEIFGHVRGSFTGADQAKMGLAEAAAGGDLFLDEIEALSLPLQAKLLRFLETGEIRRIGSKDTIRVDTRVIAATNKNLETMVRDGQFREDLQWRFSSKKILLPPLRDRACDIQELAEFFLSKEKSRKKTLSDDALRLMSDYHWPGNVRELKRVCEQMALMAPLPLIRAEEVRPLISPRAFSASVESVDYALGLEQIVNQYEARIIAQCLKQFGDIDKVADILNVSRSNLYKKIKDYNITWK
jgi:DNA-binding NtrC family response regulator